MDMEGAPHCVPVCDTRVELCYDALCALQVVIPKPSSSGPGADPPGVGLVYLEYGDSKSAEKARFALNGRTFEDRVVAARLVAAVLD